MIFNDVDRALPELRAHAESLMRDTVTIEREGSPATDVDGFVTRPMELIYTGPGKWQSPAGITRTQTGEAETIASGLALHLPFAESANVRVGDQVTCETSLDPSLIGRRFAVAEEFSKTIATSRRLRVEVIGP